MLFFVISNLVLYTIAVHNSSNNIIYSGIISLQIQQVINLTKDCLTVQCC